MKEISIARRYTAALLDEAADEAGARELGEALEVAVEVLTGPDASSALGSPALSVEDRRSLVEDLTAAMDLPERLRRFLLVIFDAGRLAALDECVDTFREQFEDRYRARKAVVEHAGPLSPELQEELKGRLEARTGDRIELELVENPALLAGWRARVGNHLVEGDLASRVERLRDRVVKGQTPWR